LVAMFGLTASTFVLVSSVRPNIATN
jgi:hypothetical protein